MRSVLRLGQTRVVFAAVSVIVFATTIMMVPAASISVPLALLLTFILTVGERFRLPTFTAWYSQGIPLTLLPYTVLLHQLDFNGLYVVLAVAAAALAAILQGQRRPRVAAETASAGLAAACAALMRVLTEPSVGIHTAVVAGCLAYVLVRTACNILLLPRTMFQLSSGSRWALPAFGLQMVFGVTLSHAWEDNRSPSLTLSVSAAAVSVWLLWRQAWKYKVAIHLQRRLMENTPPSGYGDPMVMLEAIAQMAEHEIVAAAADVSPQNDWPPIEAVVCTATRTWVLTRRVGHPLASPTPAVEWASEVPPWMGTWLGREGVFTETTPDSWRVLVVATAENRMILIRFTLPPASRDERQMVLHIAEAFGEWLSRALELYLATTPTTPIKRVQVACDRLSELISEGADPVLVERQLRRIKGLALTAASSATASARSQDVASAASSQPSTAHATASNGSGHT